MLTIIVSLLLTTVLAAPSDFFGQPQPIGHNHASEQQTGIFGQQQANFATPYHQQQQQQHISTNAFVQQFAVPSQSSVYQPQEHMALKHVESIQAASGPQQPQQFSEIVQQQQQQENLPRQVFHEQNVADFNKPSVYPNNVAEHQVTLQQQHEQSVDVAAREAARTETATADDGSSKAQILQQETEVNPDGSFYNVWNSDNGIAVQEQGSLKQVGEVEVPVRSGQISYVDAEGRQYYLKYIADENGFRVQGEHLPTPPPVPLGIARGLEYIAAHPYVETTVAFNKSEMDKAY